MSSQARSIRILSTSTRISTLRRSVIPTQHRLHRPRVLVRNMATTVTSAFAPPSSDPPKHEFAYFPQIVGALSESSAAFRRVLWTGLYSQVVLMTIPVGGDIGDEVHTVDQALTFTSGVGKATINGREQDVRSGDLMVVPAGTQHQFVNTGPTPLVSARGDFLP